jgi:predicted flavoprotein YhiN
VTLTFSPADESAFGSLSGISIDVETSCNGASFRESMLFTHRGLSGPAILQISNFWRAGDAIAINLFPGQPARELLAAERQSNKELKTVLSQFLPQRFAQEWCARVAPSRPMNQFSTSQLEEIAQKLNRWEFRPSGSEGYAKA